MTTIHDPIQHRLIIALIVYESLVIAATAYAGITIALSGGAPLFAAIPVLMVSASEGLRIPLSAWATRLSYNNRLLAVAVLGCLALASAEGISLSLDTQASPPPAPGQRMSKGEFQNTQFFREADKCKGVLVSHVNGVMVFQNGSRCYDAYPDGGRDPRLTTSRNDGDLVSCNETGEQFPNGKPHWRCYALHNGVIESVRDFRTASTIQRSAPPSDDPFSDLFQ